MKWHLAKSSPTIASIMRRGEISSEIEKKYRMKWEGKENSLKCSSKHTAARRHNGANNDDDDEKDDDEWAEYVCMTESRLMTQPWNLISHGSRNQ